MKKLALLAAATVAAFSLMSGAAYAGSASPAKFDKGRNDPAPQIIGGRPATEAYPFMATMQHKAPRPNGPQKCGATLISPHWLVTAAHCISTLDGTLLTPSDYLVRLGSTDLLGGTPYEIEKLVVHPYWGKGKESQADIGLIKLKQRAPQPYIDYVEAPSPGTPVRIIGWGRTVNNDTTSIPQRLQELDSTVRPYEDCIHGDPYDITPGDVCVDDRGGTASTCNGDSGGPLLVKVQGSWRIAGVTSRSPGESGCLNGPPVFTSTEFAWHWILVQTLNDV